MAEVCYCDTQSVDRAIATIAHEWPEVRDLGSWHGLRDGEADTPRSLPALVALSDGVYGLLHLDPDNLADNWGRICEWVSATASPDVNAVLSTDTLGRASSFDMTILGHVEGADTLDDYWDLLSPVTMMDAGDVDDMIASLRTEWPGLVDLGSYGDPAWLKPAEPRSPHSRRGPALLDLGDGTYGCLVVSDANYWQYDDDDYLEGSEGSWMSPWFASVVPGLEDCGTYLRSFNVADYPDGVVFLHLIPESA